VDINRDELRRQLREVEAEQKAVDRSWREALKRIFDPSSNVDPAVKAQLLGVPARRQFLKFGGAAVLGAAVLAACSSEARIASPGSAASSSSASGTTSGAGGVVDDLVLGKTAASLEALAVAVYDTAINSGKVTTPAIGDAAKLFMDHHKQHQNAIEAAVGLTKDSSQANAAVKSMVIDPVVSDPTLDEVKIVALAYQLEDVAAQTYVFATTLLTKAELRSTLMTIGGVEARHKAILGFMAQQKAAADIFPSAFYKSENPLPAAAMIR
jgi:hypothetical protein